MNPILVFAADYLAAKFFDWIFEKAKTIPQYCEINSKLSKETQNIAIKDLMKISIKNAINNEKIKCLTSEEIIESLKSNVDLIFEWILLSNRSIKSFSNYSDRIIYSANIEIFKMLYNSIFYQIQAYKNNYSTLQNLMILDILEDTNEKVTENLGLTKQIHNNLLNILSQNVEYTGELKKIEEKINIRKFNEAKTILASLEHKILGKGNPDEIEKYYQLLTDSCFRDPGKQQEAIKFLDELIIHTLDSNKRKKRVMLKKLLERDFDFIKNELDFIFSQDTNIEIDPSYYDIQINVYILRNELNQALDFVRKCKEKIVNYPIWLCRLYYYQSDTDNAKNIIDENDVFFSKDDFEIQILKITILAAFYLGKAIDEKSFQNIEKLREIIPKTEEIILICNDDFENLSQMYSITGLIYSVLNEPNKAAKEYEKSLEFSPQNLNTLKNYPFVLINSGNREDKEKALKLIKQYLCVCPEDRLLETLYYNTLVFLDPKKAIVEIQAYSGNNDEVKPFLLFAYDTLLEFSEAEKLIDIFLSEGKITCSIYFFIGLHYETIKNFELSLDYYSKAFQEGKTNSELDRVVDKLLKVSIFLKDKRKLQQVILTLEDRFSFDEIILKFLDLFSHALLLLFDYEKCYHYCNYAIQQNIKTKNTFEALFSCYYNTSNFYFAYTIIEKYFSEFGQPPFHIFQYFAVCCIQIDELERAYEIIKYLPKPESVLDYLYLSKYLNQIRKEKEAFEMAHKAYIAFPKNQQTMELFIDFGLNRDDKLIKDEVARDLRQCFSDYLASNFQNKIVKEYKLDTNAGPERLQQQLSEIIPERGNIIDQLEQINEQRLPLAFYKYILGKNMLLIYNLITSHKKWKIWLFDNFIDFDFINGCKKIYIDIGSLIVLDTLNLLNSLLNVFDEILVPQSVFNELREFENKIPPSNDYGYIIKDDAGHVGIVQDDIPYEYILNKSKRIISFIKNNKKVMLVGKPLIIVNKLPPELLELVKSSKFNIELDIIESSFISNISPMIENMLFRKLFNSFTESPQSFCVIDYLAFLCNTRRISLKKYCDSLSMLSKQNYTSMPFTYRELLFIVHGNGYIINDDVTHIFDIMFSDCYNNQFTFFQVISVIVLLWNELIPNEVKYKWTDYLMEKLLGYQNFTFDELEIVYTTVSKLIRNMKSEKEFLKYFEKFFKDETLK